MFIVPFGVANIAFGVFRAANGAVAYALMVFVPTESAVKVAVSTPADEIPDQTAYDE
jgi:hypothetical protein